MAGLTDKQARFVDEYLVDLNATQAAIRAGYKADRAGQQGFENLKKPEIAEAIEKAQRERSERARLKADEIIYELEKLAKPDPRDLYDDNGRLKRIKEMSADEARLIHELSMTEHGPRVKLYDRLRALEMLMKHHGLYAPEKQEVTVRQEHEDALSELE